MRILLSVEHPAWAHQFRYIVQELQAAGHEVTIAAIDKDGACELLEKFGYRYELVGRSTGKNIIEKAWLLLSLTVKIWLIARRCKVDLLIGRASPMMAITSFLLRRPHLIFEDTEHSHISLFFCRLFSKVIVTPRSFRRDLGSKQMRRPIYKESFYLHPHRFSPDPHVLTELGLTPETPYVIVRFVSWHADHDLGQQGFSLARKRQVVEALSAHARVLITSELPLDRFFDRYLIRIGREKIHSLMYYASLIYGESSTMASEAAVLGTHAIFCDFEGRGYTDEQEAKFGLVFNFKLDADAQAQSLAKAVELLRDPSLKARGKAKREVLLSEIVDGSECMLEVMRTVGGLA